MTIDLYRVGDTIIATIGRNPQVGVSGWGYTAAGALRDLADAIERERLPCRNSIRPRRGRFG